VTPGSPGGVAAIGAFTGWDAGLEAGTARLTTSQQVAHAIRRMIFDGTLRTGDRLRQEELAAALGVSRIPVREAVIALDREGWVRMESHRGAYVNGLDADSVRDHYELLGRVYGFVAARVAARVAT
jgi:DNA-binding GntR family transcriptional regulator